MRKLLTGAVAILVLSAIAWAGDPWKSKPYQQWDEKDVQTVLQASPWAKVNISAAGAWHPSYTTAITGGSLGVAGGKTDTSKASSGSTADQAGGNEKSMNAGPAIYNIFWWSARTIREASARRQVLHGTLAQDAADKAVTQVPENYQILIAGQNMSAFQQESEDYFKSNTYLEIKKSKRKINPTNVEIQKTPEGKIVGVIFSFPKKDAEGAPSIGPDEKEVDFNLHAGGSAIRTYFNPKQMIDSQGEDL
jgi:hypothetical protein